MTIRTYLKMLSSRQKKCLGATLAVAALIVGLGLTLEPEASAPASSEFTAGMTIKEMAPALGVTGKALARELELPMNIPKNKPVDDLGITQSELDHVISHILSHRPSMLKYYVLTALVLFGLVWLTYLGRPDNAEASTRRHWYPRTPYICVLLVAVFVGGFMLGKSPNPMEGAVKAFKAMAGLYPSVAVKVAVLAFFLALAIVGNKIICGWGCPLGAAQELIYSIPVLRKIKKRRVPFWISNSIRVGLFLVMLMLLFGLVADTAGFVVYHHLNAFNVFDLTFETPVVAISVIATLTLSLFLYRPFCFFICPFGLLSWLAERLSLARIRIDRTKCTACGVCVRACPSYAARDVLEGRLFGADCFSCGPSPTCSP